MRLHEEIERDLARLADGTLPPGRARELEARVAESAELQALLAEQRRSLGATATLPGRAPDALRARVEGMRRPGPPVMRARRVWAGGALVAAMAAAAIALVAILPSGAGAPTLSQAAAFSLKAPAAPAPPHTWDSRLALNVDGVSYPYWRDHFGWKAVGTRVDKVHGRTATTVFYGKGASRIGYTIVSGKPVSVSGKPAAAVVGGIRFRSIVLNGATVVTWERKDHSCILAGRGMGATELMRLAAWKDRGELD